MQVWTKSRRAMSDEDHETWVRGGVSPTLNAFDNATETRATVVVTINGSGITHTLNLSQRGVTEDGTGRGTPIIAFSHTQGLDIQASETATPTLRTQGGGMAAMNSQGVRRLTPLECERLQGFPDNWTAGQADSHRYRQMGNAVTVNVARYVASLIDTQVRESA